MSAIVTFDDGLETAYDVAYPIMKSFSLPGVCFVCGYWIDRGSWRRRPGTGWLKRPTMTLSQIKELESAGWEIGNHSFSHVDPDKTSIEKLQLDIMKGNLWIKHKVGVAPVSYAYPFCKTAGTEYAMKMHTHCRACTNQRTPIWDGRIFDKIPAIPRDLKSKTTTNSYWINRAKVESKIAVFIIHSIVDEPRLSWDIGTKDFEKLILDIIDSNIKVITFKDLKEKSERTN
jgi:peptidoglycan/xylan/chitin deacetylase (PgdA/CDA1 family)